MTVIEEGTNSHRTFFFFQAEDGIRDADVTGVQTCALPIWATRPASAMVWTSGPLPSPLRSPLTPLMLLAALKGWPSQGLPDCPLDSALQPLNSMTET